MQSNMQQILAMKPGEKGNPFSFTMARCGHASTKKKTFVQLPAYKTYDGAVFAEMHDTERKQFLLRIGSKLEGKKPELNNLELDLCTPKGPPIAKKPRTTDHETQYFLCDTKRQLIGQIEKNCKTGNGKRKGKDTKGKGGRGKAGGKGKK